MDSVNPEIITLNIICCEADQPRHSQIIQRDIVWSEIESKVITTQTQSLPAGRARGLHLAATDPEHGKVTYLQHIQQGGFYAYVGKPDQLTEHWLGPGCWAAFCDHEGTGHASKVGPEGCVRVFRLLKGLLEP